MRIDNDKRHVRRSWVAGALAASLLVAGWQRPAAAYGTREHDRIADEAYQILNLLRRGSRLPDMVARAEGSPPPSLTARPASVPADQAASWQAFVAEATAAPGRLDQLLIDLAPTRQKTVDCGNLYPDVADSKPIASCRAEELSFAVNGGWASDDVRCYLHRGYHFGDSNDPEFFQSVPSSMTGALLGYWAQYPDESWDDTYMDIRPANIFWVKAANTLAAEAEEAGAFLILAPLLCVSDLLDGGDCLDDAATAAHDSDPIRDFNELSIPGTGFDGHGTHGFSTTGMWHFVSPDRQGVYNRRPGLNISNGGLPGWIDKWDALAVAIGDWSGYTLDAEKSKGVEKYSPFADGPMSRRRGDWESMTFGHVEFEPVDNLAAYGWKNFCTERPEGRHAQYLGWPLHAIGDASQPHHTASTLGWGHRPWENFAGVMWPELFEYGKDHSAQRYADLQIILGYAFRWWTMLKSSNDDIKAMIESLAADTRSSPGAVEGGIFQKLEQDYDAADLRIIYSGQENNLKDLMLRAMGAAVAFLARASTRIEDSVSTDSPCACGKNQARRGLDLAGKILHSAACVTCGQDAFADAPYWLDSGCVAYCPEDKPFIVDGACSATCAGSGCSACPSERPFSENGACVTACSAANHFVVNGTQCASACPDGQQADSLGYCSKIVPPGPTCAMSMPGQSSAQGLGDSACCVGAGDACTTATDCCSLTCGPDGLCLGQTGDLCRGAANCLTNVCTTNRCAPSGGSGGRCASNADCQTGICEVDSQHAPAGSCRVPPGSFCANANQCGGGAICYGRFVNVCCLPGGTTCSKGADCCSGTCTQGKCTATPIYVD